MGQGALMIWLVIGLLAVSDLLLCRHMQMHFYHWSPLVIACAVTGGIFPNRDFWFALADKIRGVRVKEAQTAPPAITSIP